MSSTCCPLSMSTSNPSPNCGDSAAPVVSMRCCRKRDLVHVHRVLKRFDRAAEFVGRADGMKHVNASVAVSQATVVIGGDVEVVGVANFQELAFCIVLIVDDEVALNHFIVRHLGEFTSALHVGEGHGSVPKELTSVVVACILHQLFQSAGKVLVHAE